MKPLRLQFNGRGAVGGYSFKCLGMTDKAFLYEVSCTNSKHYEVFRKHKNKRFACVTYPGHNSFGIFAWTYLDLKLAIKKYNELIFD